MKTTKLSTIKQAKTALKGVLFEDDYVQVKLHLNGNAHCVFKRADLVDGLNAIIAKRYPNALPCPR